MIIHANTRPCRNRSSSTYNQNRTIHLIVSRILSDTKWIDEFNLKRSASWWSRTSLKLAWICDTLRGELRWHSIWRQKARWWGRQPLSCKYLYKLLNHDKSKKLSWWSDRDHLIVLAWLTGVELGSRWLTERARNNDHDKRNCKTRTGTKNHDNLSLAVANLLKSYTLTAY